MHFCDVSPLFAFIGMWETVAILSVVFVLSSRGFAGRDLQYSREDLDRFVTLGLISLAVITVLFLILAVASA